MRANCAVLRVTSEMSNCSALAAIHKSWGPGPRIGTASPVIGPDALAAVPPQTRQSFSGRSDTCGARCGWLGSDEVRVSAHSAEMLEEASALQFIREHLAFDEIP